MAEPFLGEIKLVGFSFVPRGWAFCNGQLLPINQNQALFALLGTLYGGDGRTTFALPDLRGRIPLHHGAGPGLPLMKQGERSGTETVSLTTREVPGHTHLVNASTQAATRTTPDGTFLATAGSDEIYLADNPTDALSPSSVANAGEGLPHDNRMPFLALNYIIAVFGIYPSRN
ncbi:microcystin dependent MdpB family protein [Deinococcus aerophilus]|uniref:Microcystin dependent MdpB family protein n=2 Tax=Deinococcus aerophilus TaxID=522488 RepID=A0ABQ2GYI7_9DEIO|nr:microcystin dependent MdpB family protein [Deinococcus aerophilus]